jgi:dTDP-4-dehydrorhamnose reductase
MKVLIYGSKGWIGSQFVEIMNTSGIDYVEGHSRVDNVESLEQEIILTKPSHIISFIGRTHGTIGDKVYHTIDYLENKGKIVENIRDNLFSPIALALISQRLGIHYSYLGTGCIFNYDKTHLFGNEELGSGFTESDIPNFFGSSYSVCKGFTDRLMHFFNEKVLNIRIRMPITDKVNDRNFITKITKYEKICSMPNSMTVLPELLPKILDMMQNKVVGTINLTNPGLISHNEVLEMFKEIVDSNFEWKNFSIEDQQNVLTSDRSNNFLDTTRLETLYPDTQHIKISIRECLTKYKESYKVTR